MDKQRALEMAVRHIEKDFGEGAIMKLGEAAAKMNYVDSGHFCPKSDGGCRY